MWLKVDKSGCYILCEQPVGYESNDLIDTPIIQRIDLISLSYMYPKTEHTQLDFIPTVLLIIYGKYV